MPEAPRRFLFLQGPTNFLFAEAAARLRALGHAALRINVCLGDRIFWRGPGAVDFRGRLEDWPGFVAAFLERERIGHVVLLAERREYQRLAIVAARARGIPVTVTDFGYLRPDWVIVEADGMNGQSRFPRDPAAIRALARGLPAPNREVLYRDRFLNQALWDMAFHLSSALFPWTFPHFRRHTLRHPVLTYAATGLRLARGPLERRRAARAIAGLAASGAPYYLFAMQMEDDFSLREYSRYPDLDTPIGETVTSFARGAGANAQLVFKIHPLDPGLKNWRGRIAAMARAAGVAGRVRFIDGGDLDRLIRGSAGVVTVNSTVGLRTIELGRPLAVLGEAIYNVPGIAFAGALDGFWQGAQAPEPELAEALVRALAAVVHVRGGYYGRAGIAAAAEGLAWRLHHGWVNRPVAEVCTGEPLPVEPPRTS